MYHSNNWMCHLYIISILTNIHIKYAIMFHIMTFANHVFMSNVQITLFAFYKGDNVGID